MSGLNKFQTTFTNKIRNIIPLKKIAANSRKKISTPSDRSTLQLQTFQTFKRRKIDT